MYTTGIWQTLIHNEVEKIRDNIVSESTLFHLQSSKVILSMGHSYGIQENSTCGRLAACVSEDEEQFGIKSKKPEKSLVNTCSSVYNITLTSLCREYHEKPHFIYGKVRFIGVYIIFYILFLCKMIKVLDTTS